MFTAPKLKTFRLFLEVLKTLLITFWLLLMVIEKALETLALF
jgi:hypothetical protein